MMQGMRKIDGLELPAPGTWEIDKAHTTLEFVARHMLTRVRGRFSTFSGVIRVAEVPEESAVEVEIDAASVDTNTPDRDKHLRSADFLDVEKYPKLTFKSTALRRTGSETFELDGDLTIKDVTRPVTLEAEYLGVTDSPFGTRVASFSARAEIDREDWDMTWNVVIETGGLLVGKKVVLELEVEAIYKPES
jgi:polyisoprenoid-binding protein YceI